MVGVSGDAVSCFGADGKERNVSTASAATLFTIYGPQCCLVMVLLGQERCHWPVVIHYVEDSSWKYFLNKLKWNKSNL